MKRHAFQVVDLGFGDSGKGSLVDYLTAKHSADLVVRFNGGPQAGHNVVLPDGRHHTFAQFGSGMFEPGVRTLLSRFMLIEPYAMVNEAEHLEKVGVSDPMRRMFVDGRCRVIMPPQQVANRIIERSRGKDCHGTCGMGVGECVWDDICEPELTLHAEYLGDRAYLRTKLLANLEYQRGKLKDNLSFATPEECRLFDDLSWVHTAVDLYRAVYGRVNVVSSARVGQMVCDSPCVIFEGAQGVLLDEKAGFEPHTTWSNTTFENADEILDLTDTDAERIRIGVIRCYLTRHGAGPLPTEDISLDALLPEPHNGDDGWPGRFRRGVLDLVLLRYALGVCKRIDGLAITHLDRLGILPGKVCDEYDKKNAPVKIVKARYRDFPMEQDSFVREIESGMEVKVMYRSSGPTRVDKSEALD